MQLQLQTPRPVMELGAPDGTAVWRHSSDSHAFKGTRSMLNHSKAGPRASVRLATLSSASLSSEVRIGIDRSTSRMTNATPPAHLQVHLPLLRLREDADAQQACSSRDSSHSEPVPALKPPRRVRGLPPNGLAPLLFSHCPPSQPHSSRAVKASQGRAPGSVVDVCGRRVHFQARVSIDPGPLLPPLPSASPVVQRKVSARFQPRESVFRVQHGAPEEGNPRAAGGWLEGGVRPSPRMANHHEWCSPAANAGQRRSYDGGRKWEFSLKADLAPRGIPMPQPMPVAQVPPPYLLALLRSFLAPPPL